MKNEIGRVDLSINMNIFGEAKYGRGLHRVNRTWALPLEDEKMRR